ncbi:hypothetical protein HBA54_00625 [Pelagibius litoralis]|uniref:Uncharacterized protein n=1 Tax=Pelagibius litoralis TaxID=374515 RepID=A0A967C2I4_9PROT|nr:hypothetical protein [Pelagibius litoralis]NIA67090.1 hypothetical protein [Pelagibius litoralis]
MRTQSTKKVSQGAETAALPSDADTARPGKKPLHVNKSSRLLCWKTNLFQSLGRELHALHRQQQERAFMATSHGVNYRDDAVRISTLH